MKNSSSLSSNKLNSSNKNEYNFYLNKLEEENVTDKEVAIQSKRLIAILDKTVQKLKILAHLPCCFLENGGKILTENLPTIESDYILYVCKKFPNNNLCLTTEICGNNFQIIKNSLDPTHLKNSKEGKIQEMCDVYMSKVVDLILSCPNLVKRAENECQTEFDTSTNKFLKLIETLQGIVIGNLKINVKEQLRRENEVKMAIRTNSELNEHLKGIQTHLDQQRQQLGNEKLEKEENVERLKTKIENLQTQFKNDVNKIVLESEKAMMEDAIISDVCQSELLTESQNTTERYQKLLNDHLIEEKLVRAKRLKVETQLASWLTKYDQDMSDRQREMEELQKAYDDEKTEFEELQEKFDKLEEEYIELMAEKDEEEQKIFEERAFRFLMNRAAKIIQNCWRGYKERKLARKKGRKGKKKESDGKKKKAPKEEKPKDKVLLRGGPDPNAVLESKFKDDIMRDLTADKSFNKQEIVVNLSAV